MLEARTVVNQCYILQESLGEDCFCELWRATSIYSATQFLLRFLKEDPRLEAKGGEFRRLAMDCYSIAGAAIQDFVEVENWGGRTFIASEYGGQKNLAAYLAGSPRVRLEHACRFLIELGQGLDAFHKRGIVYTCLNAENILVAAPAGHVESIRVQKPGYAVFLPLVDESDKAAVFGNYGYLSPEAKAGLPLDRRSDIYSLAVLFFRFVVGKLPYGNAARARSGSVSLSYVARAFARRDIPDVVTRIILRALRKRPAQRQADAIELIAGLRSFMDERRRELLASGGVDPVAELETLNLGKDRVDASQAVRSLDTADYFRAISEAFVAPQSEEAPRLFPVDDFLRPDEVERVEAEEAEGDEDDGRPSVESWISAAKESVGRETLSERRGVAKPPLAMAPSADVEPETPEAASPAAPATGRPVAEAVSGEEEPSLVRNPLDLALELPSLPPLAEEGEAAVYASDPAPARARKRQKASIVDTGGVSWRPASARPQEVAEGMESAFSRAFKGMGAFRFIQEPPPGPEVVAFARVFARFRAKGLVVDLGVLPARADSTDLLRALRESLALGLGYETPQARAALARRLGKLDDIGAFAGPPLGALLFGADGEEPDPAWIETTEGAMRLALTLASLGRRRRPLVLTLRGAEAMGRSAHDVLVELARLAPIASFCCFAFYKPSPVPDWHVLSRLAAG